MGTRLWPVVTVGFVILAGCGEDPPTPGRDVGFASVCDKANKGQRLAVVGYLRLPPSIKSNEIHSSLRLYPEPRFTGKPVRVGAVFGGAANQVEKPSGRYSDKDLKVHLADGGLATLGTRVKVSGEMYVPLVEQKGEEGFDCGLTNPLIQAAPAAAGQ
jgi:hypothetical protein